MVKVVKILICFMFASCSKYQVVSEVQINMYHMHNPRTKQIEIILTEEKLQVGEFYRLKSIKQIEIDESGR